MEIDIKKVLKLHPPVFTQEADGGYSVEVPDFPGCVSEGDTYQEAQAMIEEAAYGWILSMRDYGFPFALAPELNALHRRELVR